MREAVIVSAARTPIGKAYRGAYNKTDAPTLGSYSIKEAVERAKVDPNEIEDVIMGCAQQQGSQALNIGRLSGIAAGLPITVPGMTIDRQCSSGLMAIATGAKQIMTDNMNVVVAGGVESISLVQTAELRFAPDPNVVKLADNAYMPMIETADFVAEKYNISREYQDEYSLQSQQRTAAAQESNKFDDEIISTTTFILSVIICFAPVAMAIRPEEHCLSIVIPGTVIGNPAAIPLNLPMFNACEPCC